MKYLDFYVHTNKVDSLRKEACQILAPVICDGDLHVFEAAALFKHIRQVLSHIHDVLL